MGWEYRGSYGPYYTRSKKVNGRVIREYVGQGRFGDLSAYIDAEERRKRHAKFDADRKLIMEYEEADQMLDTLFNSIDMLTRAVLYASGYHQHKHGEWRYRRGCQTQETK